MSETTITEWARTLGVSPQQIGDFLAEQGLLPVGAMTLSTAAVQALQRRFGPSMGTRSRQSGAAAVGKPVGLHGVGKKAIAARPPRPARMATPRPEGSPTLGSAAATTQSPASPQRAATTTPRRQPVGLPHPPDSPARPAPPREQVASTPVAARPTPPLVPTAPAAQAPPATALTAAPSAEVSVSPMLTPAAAPAPATAVRTGPKPPESRPAATVPPRESTTATPARPAQPVGESTAESAPARPNGRAAVKPAARPQTRSQTRPQSRPQTRPAARPAARATSAPAMRPGTGQRPVPSGAGRSSGRTQAGARARTSSSRPWEQRSAGVHGHTQREVATPNLPPAGPTHKTVEISEQITVKDLAQQLGKPVAEVIKELMKAGLMATVNQSIDQETAALVAQEFGAEVKLKQPTSILEIEDQPDPEDSLKPRPPVVTIMGHVDHGKTTLLDAIRESHVAASEAGGITQHIGAYQAEIHGRRITFLDTPGHEAFTAMRARGAQVTDIAVLVVAADDGVMPQTIEAIHHAQAAKVPIVVAINKIDKPGANPERIKQQLTEYGLVAEEWGGDTIFVPVSALRKQGLDELLEMILLTADVQELKANPDRAARGVVIEAQLDRQRGPLATILVEKGTLRVGDLVVAGATMGRVRVLFNEKGKRMSRCGPSSPAVMVGLNDVPTAGDEFVAMQDERLARQVVSSRLERQRQQELQPQQAVTLEGLYQKIQEGETKELNLIIKADVQGSVEALRQALRGLHEEGVRVNIIHAAVGGITESDVHLAEASQAIIIGFNVRPDATGVKAAEQAKVDVRLYQIIYDVISDVQAALRGMLAPKTQENTLGRAEVRQTFHIPKVGEVAGCVVLSGRIARNAMIRILRDSKVIFEGRIASLKRFKDDVREVTEGYECGIGVERFNDIKEGDVLEAYRIEEVPATPAQ